MHVGGPQGTAWNDKKGRGRQDLFQRESYGLISEYIRGTRLLMSQVTS